MKKLFLSAGFVLALSCTTALAQNCATGYCPATITVHHKAGSVAPETVDITYGVVSSVYSGGQKCWITRNLGATQQATIPTDATVASAGWYFQFDSSQGFSYSSGSRYPATTWIASISESNDWLPANDPCTLMLGSTWRLPTKVEWVSVANLGGISTSATAYASLLKLHLGGAISFDGLLTTYPRGSYGYEWSSTSSSSSNGCDITINTGNAYDTTLKAYAFSVRCLRDY